MMPSYAINCRVAPIDSDDQKLGMGARPRRDKLGSHSPIFEERFRDQLVPMAEWDDILETFQISDRDDVKSIWNQLREGSCFPKGTLVRMADGTQKPIEHIRVLDKVVSAQGNVRQVVATQAKEANLLYRLHMRGHHHLRATAEHPILTQNGYVEISKLKRKDQVAFPKYLPQTETFVETTQYIPRRTLLNTKSGTRGVGIPGKPATVLVRNVIPDIIHLTHGFGRIMGLFLAEGSTSHQKVSWCFGSHERVTLVEELVTLLKRELGVEAKVRTRGCSTAYVTIYGVTWARFFEGMCATGARHKRLHPLLASGTSEFLDGVFSGWVDGDREEGNIGVTISHELAMNMFDIGNALGRRPVVGVREQFATGIVKHRHPRWHAGYREFKSARGFQPQQDDQYMWRPVNEVTEEPFNGYVFNLEVETDHSYIAEGVGVHNCAGFSCAQGMCIQAKGQGFVYPQLSPISLYKRTGRSPSSGSTLSDNVREARDVGVLPFTGERDKLEIMGCDPSHVMPMTGFHTPFPAGWQETAKHFRLGEYYDVRSMEGFGSALLRGWPVYYGRAGHAIVAVELLKHQGQWHILYANSWGQQWGDQGFGLDSFSFVRNAIRSYGCFAFETIVDTDDLLRLSA